MKCHLACRVALVCWIMVWIANLLTAQQPATGLPPLGSFAGGPFDTVNLANLDVHFSIPIFARAGKGIPFSYSLSYDSLNWEPVTSGSTTSWEPVASGVTSPGHPIYNWGWRAVTEAATGYVTAGNPTVSTCYYGSLHIPGSITNRWTDFVYHDPLGGVHPYPSSYYVVSTVNLGGSGNTCPSNSYTNFTNAVAPDNSGYILSVNVSSDLPVATLNARGGLIIQVPPVQSSTGTGSITDANANQISISSTGVITDTLGTTALTVSGNAPTNPPSCSPAVTYTYTAPSGAAANVTVNYAYYVVQTNFGVSGTAEFGPTSECLVNSIQLPDGSSYSFQYETTVGNGISGKTTGRLASVTLPTGGTICYSYGGTGCTTATSNSMMADGSPSAMTDKNESGPQIWTYARAVQPSQQLPQTVTTITDSAGNVTTRNFSGVYQTASTVNQGPSTALDYSYICYNGTSPPACPTATVAAPLTQVMAYDFPNKTSLYSTIQHNYDTYGNVTAEYDYNYGTQQTVGSTTTSYDSALCGGSLHFCNRPDSITVTLRGDPNSPNVSQL